MSNNIYRYYVYAYLRSDGTPYYIGKGCNNRAYKKHGTIPVPKDKSRIVFLETNLSNIGACALERRYIRWYGRKDLGTGILRNRTDGGEGKHNCYVSEYTRSRIRLANTGKTNTSEQKAKISAANKGKTHKLEPGIKISNTHKHKPKSTEHKNKLSIANTGKKHRLETILKMSGPNSSQYGTMWITNGVQNKKVKKNDLIPSGWKKERVL